MASSESSPPDTIEARAAPIEDQDEKILAELYAGNFSRFDTLVNRYKGRLLQYLAHQVRHLELAEDLAQETFLKILRSPPRELHSAQFCTWLFVLARHTAIDHLRQVERRAQARERLAAIAAARVSSLDPATIASIEEQRSRIGLHIAKLPPEQQEVVSLKVFAQLSLVQIAEVTHVPLATVKSRLRYGLLKLGQMLPEIGP